MKEEREIGKQRQKREEKEREEVRGDEMGNREEEKRNRKKEKKNMRKEEEIKGGGQKGEKTKVRSVKRRE